MSVMSCNRKGCENILCDRYSKKYGYICNDCFSELLDSTKLPSEFMHTDKISIAYLDQYKKFHNEQMEIEFPDINKEKKN